MEINKKRTCSIALMSGKGGSGKTTLALSMASLLSSCGVKTLLIDCDISTNGATYFFEEKMAYYTHHIDTIHEVLVNPNKYDDIHAYPVNEFFDFLPSVTKIGEVWTVVAMDPERELYLGKLFKYLSDRYEVVIYDCQAGYTQILETVIRMADRNLMVLEADSVSASAVRNLFLKLNNVWDNKRIYQIFNKATKEEAEIYSKVTSGTLFDNIGCILFDWTVRRSFSISEIPDMIHTSTEYGIQVCDLCIALIKNPEISKKLTLWIKNRKLDALIAKEQEINKEVEQVSLKLSKEKESEKREKRLLEFELISTCLGIIIMFLLIIIIRNLEPDLLSLNSRENFIVFMSLIGLLSGAVTTLVTRLLRRPRSSTIVAIIRYEEMIKSYKNSLENVQENILNLKKSINEINEGEK